MTYIRAVGIDVETTGTSPALTTRRSNLLPSACGSIPPLARMTTSRRSSRPASIRDATSPRPHPRCTISPRTTCVDSLTSPRRCTASRRRCGPSSPPLWWPTTLVSRRPSCPISRPSLVPEDPPLGVHPAPRTARVARRAELRPAGAALLAGRDAGRADDGRPPGLVRCGVQRPAARGALPGDDGGGRDRDPQAALGPEPPNAATPAGPVRQAPGEALVGSAGGLLSLARGQGRGRLRRALRPGGGGNCESRPPRGVCAAV